MEYRVYLLDISQWLQKVNRENGGLMLEDDSARHSLTLISKERVEKVLRARTPLGQAHSLGAGLLLQYVWMLGQEVVDGMQKQDSVQWVSVPQLLSVLQDMQPGDIPMTYSPKGKPYFADKNVYFSLSHSGDYVLCAVSREEIGADIQQCKPGVGESLVRKVLNETELVQWQDLQQDENFFYRKWAEKEACGKLTGSGVFELILRGSEPSVSVYTDTLWVVPGYCISVCQCHK